MIKPLQFMKIKVCILTAFYHIVVQEVPDVRWTCLASFCSYERPVDTFNSQGDIKTSCLEKIFTSKFTLESLPTRTQALLSLNTNPPHNKPLLQYCICPLCVVYTESDLIYKVRLTSKSTYERLSEQILFISRGPPVLYC